MTKRAFKNRFFLENSAGSRKNTGNSRVARTRKWIMEGGAPIIGSKKYKTVQVIISRAGCIAVKKAQQARLPITGTFKGKIIKKYADGTIQVLGTVPLRVKPGKRVYSL